MRRGLGLFAAAVLVLTACGSPQAQRAERAEQVPPLLAQAAAATQAAGAARVVNHGTQELPAFGKPIKTSGFGVVDGRRMHMFLDMGKAPATGDMGTAEIIGAGTSMYIKSTFFAALAPDQKPWLEFDFVALGEKMGLDFGAIMQLGRDPMQSMDYLYGAKDVETVGHENLYGVRTTHYRAVVDFRAAPDLAPPELRDRIANTMDRFVEMTGMETAPMEVWVDETGLLRRMKFSFDFTQADSSSGIPPMKMTETMDFVKYGIDAKITVPPPSQVTDLLQYIEESDGSASF